jgi:iron complex outermembrane recepter protein
MLKTLFGTLSLTSLMTAPALAQDAGVPADEDALVQAPVIVTVQKREEAAIDVPVAVSVVDNAFLEDLGLDEFDQVARFVPGFEVQEQSPNNPGFVIRGITSDSGEANIEPRIAIFQDGVSISRSRGSVVELFDIQRVEVAKGPQPTLFGRGALIGGINVIQAKPQLDTYNGEVTLGFGNYNEKYADGYVTGPIVDDVLGFRVAARYRERDGYVESLNPADEDFNSQDMVAVRASLAWEPTTDIRFDLIGNYQDDNPSGTSFKSGAFEPAPGASTAPWDPANLNTFGDFLGGKPLGLERTVSSVTLLGEWGISDALSLTSITGYRDIDSVEVFDPDGFGLELLIFGEDYQGEQLSQEFRVNYDDGGRLRGFAGVSYFDEEGQQGVPLTYDERAVQALLGGFLVPPNAPPVDALPATNLDPNVIALLGTVPLKPIHNEVFTNFGETQAIEAFGDVTFDVTERLQLTGGVRFTSEDKESALLVELPEGPSNLTLAGIFVQPTGDLPGANADGSISASDTFDDVTWRAAAKYALGDNTNFYANAARGRRPEVITAQAGSPQAGFTTLDAEIVDAFEAGVKTVLFGELRLDASAFYYDYNNFQTTEVNAETGLIEPINAGDATADGFEITGEWTIEGKSSLVFSYGYNHARFDEEAGAPFSGNRLRLSPDNTASVAGRFFFETDFGEFAVIPSLTWQGDVFFTNEERVDLSQDAYSLANLNLVWTAPNGLYSVEAYGTNLADEDYIIDAGNTGDAFGIPTFIAGPPRFYGMRITGRF